MVQIYTTRYILQDYTSKFVDIIRGHSIHIAANLSLTNHRRLVTVRGILQR